MKYACSNLIVAVIAAVYMLTGANAAAQSPVDPAGFQLPATVHAGCPVNPQAVKFEQRQDVLRKGLLTMYEEKRTVPMVTLVSQLGRGRCDLALPAIQGRKRELPDLYEDAKKSVMFIGTIGHCGAKSCSVMHLNVSTGCMITESGVMITAYHVLESSNAVAMAAMDFSGWIYPVKEVLASDVGHDVAILQLDGRGFIPLPLTSDARIGSAIAVISNVHGAYCVLSSGIITQYPVLNGNLSQNKGMDVQMMGVSAEYGVGSSGAPVLNERGEIVGIVSSTRPITPANHGDGGVQMVCRYCVPTAAIINLVRLR